MTTFCHGIIKDIFDCQFERIEIENKVHVDEYDESIPFIFSPSIEEELFVKSLSSTLIFIIFFIFSASWLKVLYTLICHLSTELLLAETLKSRV